MGLATKLYSFFFPEEEHQCPADMSNSECSLVSELREVQKEFDELNKDGSWEFDRDFNYNSIKFKFTYRNNEGKKDYCKYSDKELEDTYDKLFQELGKIISLQYREYELKKQLGLK